MAETPYRPEHAQQVIKVATNELEVLLRQQVAISKKVKEVKRTVRGLAMLFGMGDIGITRSERGVSRKKQEAPANDRLKPKLQRACRIALLEAEEAASAAQVYDRIVRRGSYRLVRYRHPLAEVIKTLNMLESRGEVQVFVEGDCRRWRWNNPLPLLNGDEGNPYPDRYCHL